MHSVSLAAAVLNRDYLSCLNRDLRQYHFEPFAECVCVRDHENRVGIAGDLSLLYAMDVTGVLSAGLALFYLADVIWTAHTRQPPKYILAIVERPLPTLRINPKPQN